MDADIEFGEVEEAGREVNLRPDQNRHLAVVAVHDPQSSDLPVYVDIDVMRDMEMHALTDTSVELGGVMLGGQYEDENGDPFVVVTDSLRAEHYEATKGSFKFTHETWQQISRQREEFPEDLQMVGWYHTHPDWGVFLSGMDMFICDHFFNRPLDLALVIDPCRGDRGWFQWVPDSKEKIRRTGGYYLTGSRFRRPELEYFAFQLKGKLSMAADYRSSGVAGSVGPSLPPVVNISESGNATNQYAVFGLLAMQFLFLMVISWKILFGGESESLREMKQQIATMSEQKLSEQRVKILEKALTLSGDKLQLANLLDEKQRLEIQLEDSIARRQQLDSENKSVEARYRVIDLENANLEKRLSQKKNEVSELENRVRELGKSGSTDQKPFWKNTTLIMLVAAIGFVCAMGGGILGFLMGRVGNDDNEDGPSEIPLQINDKMDDPKQDFDAVAESQGDDENVSPGQ